MVWWALNFFTGSGVVINTGEEDRIVLIDHGDDDGDDDDDGDGDGPQWNNWYDVVVGGGTEDIFVGGGTDEFFFEINGGGTEDI